MLRATALLCAGLFAALHADASTLYIFSYTGLSSPFQNFTVAFTEPGGITGPQDYSISAPFTDGTTTWNFTQFYIAAGPGSNQFCVVLGTSLLSSPSCSGFTFPGGASNASQGEIITSFFDLGGLPTGASHFSNSSQSFSGFSATDTFKSTTGTASIIFNPEPGSVLLTGSVLLLCGLLFRRFRPARAPLD